MLSTTAEASEQALALRRLKSAVRLAAFAGDVEADPLAVVRKRLAASGLREMRDF
jgi:hypothetical protein